MATCYFRKIFFSPRKGRILMGSNGEDKPVVLVEERLEVIVQVGN